MQYAIDLLGIVISLRSTSYGAERGVLTLKEQALKERARAFANRFLKENTQALLTEFPGKLPFELANDLKM